MNIIEEDRKSGLYHNFFLLDTEKYFPTKDSIVDISVAWNKYKCVNIHCDHLSYFGDSLRWIPSYNPIKKETYYGFYWHSTNIIRKDGAIVAEKVFDTWADLLSIGLKTLSLTGGCRFNPENLEEIIHNKLELNRDEIIGKLRTLSFYCKEVIKSKDKKFIQHYGI